MASSTIALGSSSGMNLQRYKVSHRSPAISNRPGLATAAPLRTLRCIRTRVSQVDKTSRTNRGGGSSSDSFDEDSSSAPVLAPRARKSTSVDEQDTPEALADVEETTVAPAIEWLTDSNDVLTISYALIIGAVVAASVFTFDVSIQYIHDLPDIFAKELHIGGGRATGFEVGDVAIPFR